MSSMGHPADENLETKEMDVRSLSSSHGQAPYVHKVGIPPRQNLFKEFQATVKETLFADDPLRSFKDQSKSRKFILGMEAIFPILSWGRTYSLKKFRGDLIAGLTIASLCIPQDIGYAKLANLTPQYGLYSSFIPPLVYSIMGNSRDIAIGPVAEVSLLLGTLLRNEIDPIANAADYRRLAFTATFFTGITQITLGVFRLGFFIDFLSHAAIVGFMGGSAITIALQQLKVSFSRSAVNFMAGCETAVSNIVMSVVVFLTLQFITSLFKYTPIAILSSIIISTFVNLVDYQAAILTWNIDKFDFVACMGAFFGVVFASVEIGLLIAVSISFAKILLQVTRPRTAILGKIPRTTVYRNIQQYPEATKVPGVLIVRVDSAIYFSNSNYVKERILRWLMDEEEQVKGDYQTRIQFLIVEMSPVTDIDTSGIHALEELHRSLQKRDVQLVLANPGPVVIDKLHTSNFAHLLGEDKIFLTVAEAVAYCSPKLAEDP